MRGKAVFGMMLTLLLIGMSTLAFNIQPVKASGTIYIRADGSVEPDTAPISTVDNVTYTFTDNIHESIVVERDNIVVDGAGYPLTWSTIPRSGTGIALSDRSNVTIKNVEIYTMIYCAIYLIRSSNNNISGNNIEYNNEYGILLDDSSNNSILGNNITNNNFGIWSDYSSNNTISGNNITNNGAIGVALYESNGNTFTDNTISESYVGISLEYSKDNILYHNNFVDNLWLQVYIYWSTSVWDDGYPSGGNYWSDHVCTGNPSDGSQPLIIDANNIDHYPFQHPNGWLRHQLTVTSSPITGITFTVDGTSETTLYIEWLLEGSYTLEMHETHDGYVWSHWLEDGDTNRTKTVIMDTNIALTGVFFHIADLNHDGVVDIRDIATAALAFGSCPTHPRWNPIADINKDNKVDIRDIATIAKGFGK